MPLIETNKVYKFTLTFDTNTDTIKFYVNNELKSTSTNDLSSFIDNSIEFKIGITGAYYDCSPYVAVAVDEVLITNTLLQPDVKPTLPPTISPSPSPISTPTPTQSGGKGTRRRPSRAVRTRCSRAGRRRGRR